MLTESALFFLNLCHDYRDLQNVKATAGASEAWLKQVKVTTTVQRRSLITEDSNDNATAPKATSDKPSKKRITNSGIAIVVHVQPSVKQSSWASTLGDSEKVPDEEPMDVQTGLEDKDDKEEWKGISQSPVKKRGVRISDHVHFRRVRLSAPC